MTVEEVALEVLLDTREELIGRIQQRAKKEASRRFLTSFHELRPDWSAIGFDETIADLPAVKWKALNLRKLKDENAVKFEQELERLVTFFDG
jgi:hypothetical protein